MGIEPTPIPWQGIVLPLNYGRVALPEEGLTFIARLLPRVQAGRVRKEKRRLKACAPAQLISWIRVLRTTGDFF